MRYLSVLIPLLFFSYSSLAYSVDPQTLVTQLQSTYKNSKNWKADFTQSTFVELLDRNIQKEGQIFIQKPGKLRIEYHGDQKKYYMSNGKRLWIYVEGDTQVEVYKKISDILAKEALTFLEGLGEIKKEFDVQPVGIETSQINLVDSQLNLLLLIPKNSASLVEKIVLGIDPQNGMVKETVLLNRSGNITHYVFRNIQFNENLSDNLFEFKKPKSVKEISR